MSTKRSITAHITCDQQGFFQATPVEDLPFLLLGEGKTAEEAKRDFLAAAKIMRQVYRARTGEDLKLDIHFTLDASAFLQLYKGIFTLAGLSRLTGINKVQLSQYVCGTRRPSGKTAERIRRAVHQLADELKQAFV